LTFNPGIILAFPNFSGSSTQFGLAFPIGFQIGFPVADKWTINASLELPMYATFGDFGSFYIPILIGGGVEWMFQPNLAFTGKLALGPTIATASSTTIDGVSVGVGGGTVFTVQFLAGVAYKFN
jgi:hypothetical protein